MFSILKRVSVVLAAQSCPTLCDPMDYSCQALLSMEFSRQEYWSELPFPSPGDLPHPGIEPRSLAVQADSLPSEPTGVPRLTNDIAFLKSSFSKIPEMVPVTHVLPRRDLPGNTASGTGCPVRLCLLTEVELIYRTPGDAEGQGSLACCRPWGHREPNTTEQLNNSFNRILTLVLPA